MIKETLSENIRRRLDILEQVGLLFFYLWFLRRLWPASLAEMTIYGSLILVSESLVVALLLIRKPTVTISHSFYNWIIAFSGSFLPLLVRGGGESQLLHVGAWLMIFGLITHVGAKLSLFRSFGVVPANRGVKIKGLYSIVRHPMYAGYFFTHLGFFLCSSSFWNFAIYAFTWMFMLARIFAEEKILMQSQEYQDYVKVVTYRLIPGVL